jgi:hypothetical protein
MENGSKQWRQQFRKSAIDKELLLSQKGQTAGIVLGTASEKHTLIASP